MIKYKLIDKKFELEKRNRISQYSKNSKIKKIFHDYNYQMSLAKYSYNFSWMGVPIIQYPDDMIVVQELICNLNPDLIVETGVARGGSLIYYASILKLLGKKNSKVVGIDIDIRKHTKKVFNQHPLKNKITLISGSSIDPQTFKKVKFISKNYRKKLVILDSNHTHQHVLKELNFYSKIVSKNSYIIVFDSTVNILKKKNVMKLKKNYHLKQWGKDNNPMTAIFEFIKKNKSFKIDKSFNYKPLCSNTFNGFLIKK